jgi:hypothetical protein
LPPAIASSRPPPATPPNWLTSRPPPTEDGRARIILGVIEGEPSVEIRDKGGTARIRIGLNTLNGEDRECPEIELFNDEGNWLASLGVSVTPETPKLDNPLLYEGDMRYEEPYLYLCSRTSEGVSAIDMLVLGNEPTLLFKTSARSDKYGVTVDGEGRLVVTKNPFA